MPAADALSFNELEVGREWLSLPRVISADNIGDFCEVTGDGTPTDGQLGDVDSVAIEDRCIATGLFGPSVATGLALDAPPVRTIAFLSIRDWRFLGPIVAGDALHIRNRVQEITPRGVGRRGEVAWRVEIINQREEIVQAGVIVTLVEGDAVSKRTREPKQERSS